MIFFKKYLYREIIIYEVSQNNINAFQSERGNFKMMMTAYDFYVSFNSPVSGKGETNSKGTKGSGISLKYSTTILAIT